jgi:hypothetical protein
VCAFASKNADGLKHPKRPKTVSIRGIFGRLERDLDMTLSGEIIDLVRLDFLHDANEIGGIGETAVMESEAQVPFVGILVQMIDMAGVEGAGTAFRLMS